MATKGRIIEIRQRMAPLPKQAEETETLTSNHLGKEQWASGCTDPEYPPILQRKQVLLGVGV